MSEIVTIVTSGDNVEVITTQIIQQVSIYTGVISQGGGTATPISKIFYKANGSEGPSITIPGIGNSVWSQVTQGVTPLEQVSGLPGPLQYTLNGDNVIFGDHPQAGENILIEWQ